MADFEGLIRQALARQNDADPAIREKVYQSSRKALARMIASAGVQPPEVINRQRMALEDSIRRIEADYRAAGPSRPSRPAPRDIPPPPRAHAQDRERRPPPVRQPPTHQPSAHQPSAHQPSAGRPSAPVASQPAATPRPRQPAGANFDPRIEAEPEFTERQAGRGGHGSDYYSYDDGAAGVPGQPDSTVFRRIIAVLALVAILGVIGWLGYTLYASVIGNPRTEPIAIQPAPAESPATTPADQQADSKASYITILSPADTTALETAGRGKAEIVRQSNMEMIRLTSLRPADKLANPAPPMLISFQDGVLARIAGKQVTVEILAKSGSSGPAAFTVGCEFAGEDLCGRKRFRIGIQPEPVVFTIDIRRDLADAAPAFLTLNTDITSSASLTGEGEPIDIVYVRLRLPK